MYKMNEFMNICGRRRVGKDASVIKHLINEVLKYN